MIGNIGWETIVTGASGLGIAVLAVYNRALAARVKLATSQAEVAQANGERAISDAGQSVFELVTRRLETVEKELTDVRNELVLVRAQVMERDNKIHALELHIMDLEQTLRAHNIDPPRIRSLYP